MRCRRCDAEVGPGVRFCTECGADQLTTCPRCGSAISLEARYCGTCGASLEPAIGPELSPVGVPEAARGRRRWPALAAAGLVVLVVIAGLVLVRNRGPTPSENQGPRTRVLLEAASEVGPDPFTPSLATSTHPFNEGPAVAITPGAGGRATVLGSEPGLYGGTEREAACDASQLIAYLAEHRAKAAAWASVQGIEPEEIPAFIAGLTPVVLMHDTLVTNHGYAHGEPVARTSVLQAGTAVLVDTYGVPRVRCFCGNPLLPPRSVGGTASYTGTAWTGYEQGSEVVIGGCDEPVEGFELVDLEGGGSFTQPAGAVGGLIAFTRGNEPNQQCEFGTADVYVMDAQGRGETRLTRIDCGAQASYPSWSPDGRSIAFEMDSTDEAPDNIFLVRAGVAPEPMGIPVASILGISWSPDGDRMATAALPPLPPPDYMFGPIDLYVAEIGTSRVTRLTSSPDVGVAIGEPDWSPDGRFIAYSVGAADGSGIEVVRANGGRPRLIVGGEGGYTSPSWSLDGRQIAFVRTPLDGDSDIFVVNADGSDLEQLTSGPESDSAPAWSPDGTKIAFVRDGDIYLMDADGSNVEQLTQGPQDDGQPAWQPLAGWGTWAPAGETDAGSSTYTLEVPGSGGSVGLITITHRGDHLDFTVEALSGEFNFNVGCLGIGTWTLESLWYSDYGDYVDWHGFEPNGDVIFVGSDLRVLEFSVWPSTNQDFSRPIEIEWTCSSPFPSVTVMPLDTGVVSDEETYVFYDCANAGIRPRYIVFVCDHTSVVESLHWETWETTRALGRGVFRMNDCDPNCGDGTYEDRRGRIVLSDRQWCESASAFVFSTATITYQRPYHGQSGGETSMTCW